MPEATTLKRPKQVGQLLVEQQLITPDQLNEALDVQKRGGTGKLLGEIIVELGFCTEAQVLEALADAYDVPFARIVPGLADPNALDVLPADFVENNTVLPLFKVDNVLTVAVTEPANVFLIEEIAQLAGCPAQIVAALKADLEQTLAACRPGMQDVPSMTC